MIDTHALAAELCSRRGEARPESVRLAPLARELGLPVHRPHDAAGDVLTTAQVFLALATHLDGDRAADGGLAVRAAPPRRSAAAHPASAAAAARPLGADPLALRVEQRLASRPRPRPTRRRSRPRPRSRARRARAAGRRRRSSARPCSRSRRWSPGPRSRRRSGPARCRARPSAGPSSSQAAEPGPRAALLRLGQRVAADEAALLVELDAEADARPRRGSRRG